jgi:hypothetical protein
MYYHLLFDHAIFMMERHHGWLHSHAGGKRLSLDVTTAVGRNCHQFF